MISRKEALDRSLKNTDLKGEIWNEIVSASRKGETQAEVHGISMYSSETISKNLKLLRLEGYENIRLTNNFDTLIIKW